MVDPPPPIAAPIKCLQTLPPDVIVSVGGVEFECYKLALCFASNYLNTMLRVGMREDQTSWIELPGKDLEEWKEFNKITGGTMLDFYNLPVPGFC